jgi:hypothetical protein
LNTNNKTKELDFLLIELVFKRLSVELCFS